MWGAYWILKIFVKLQAKSLDQELTLFYPCHKKKKKKKKNPHQNLSMGLGPVLVLQ